MDDAQGKKLQAMQELVDSIGESFPQAADHAARLNVTVEQTMLTLAEQRSIPSRALEQYRASMQAILGPLDDLRHVTLGPAVLGAMDDLQHIAFPLVSSQLSQALEEAAQMAQAYTRSFRLPLEGEIPQLAAHFAATAQAAVQQPLLTQSLAQQAMEAMHTSWLDTTAVAQSVRGFTAVQSIGINLSLMPTFGDTVASALRTYLGDWRETMTWPEPLFTDILGRREFYVAHGFDPALTDFPAPAFRESIDLAALRNEPPDLVEQYGTPFVPSDDPHEEQAFARTNTAHEWLLRLETQIRCYIDTVMTKAYGVQWPKHQLPNGIYEKWCDKQRRAEQAGGATLPLIAYADFTDYAALICRSDNWRDIFAPIFLRQENVRESFQRLHPIRICTMHARLITQDDELLLYVEVKRLMQAIS